MFHGVAEQGIPTKAIAEVISEKLSIPISLKMFDEVVGHFGFLAYVLAGDNPTLSKDTQEYLGWQPLHPALLKDLKAGKYFN
ncbi:hypothetical protein CDV55_108446 [Aspergillus turcosus]|uniref:3-beta hydroxysteroid dehydrogenase/isomerase domain-containing protein n=1 Tax=Aspergillus turcosus TaxID=1245748 RepID=A0A229YE96_9EURO|nr:hypothetical protein CDV55_108446 [Aspergillus turcosus]RLL93036.1 hypothetical protein CFD26_100937 [Aspergillus turcosus]